MEPRKRFFWGGIRQKVQRNHLPRALGLKWPRNHLARAPLGRLNGLKSLIRRFIVLFLGEQKESPKKHLATTALRLPGVPQEFLQKASLP